MRSLTLKRLERRERQLLTHQPLAMDRRLVLANLLLLRAWFWIGKAERLDDDSPSAIPGQAGRMRGKARAVAFANVLVGSCLHEAFLVSHLAPSVQLRTDAIRLQDLVRETANPTLVRDAERQAQEHMNRLILAVGSDSVAPIPRSRKQD